MTNLVEIRDLTVEATTDSGRWIQILKGIDLDIAAGETVAFIGESGSGKTTAAMTLLGYARPGCRISGGTVRVDGHDMVTLSEKQRAALRGTVVAYVPQSAAAAFNPAATIMDQVIEVTRIHQLMAPDEARRRAVALFRALSLPNPDSIGDRYPHQVSGGQLQRLAAAMALIGDPKVVIFDEPTTALDVTTEAQILDLLKHLQAELGMAIIFITHNFGVIADIADRVSVMYLGRIVETATVDDIFYAPKHPYTKALLRSIPRLGVDQGRRLPTIPGMVPDPFSVPPGCAFNPRCAYAVAGICDTTTPPEKHFGAQISRCHFAEKLAEDYAHV